MCDKYISKPIEVKIVTESSIKQSTNNPFQKYSHMDSKSNPNFFETDNKKLRKKHSNSTTLKLPFLKGDVTSYEDINDVNSYSNKSKTLLKKQSSILCLVDEETKVQEELELIIKKSELVTNEVLRYFKIIKEHSPVPYKPKIPVYFGKFPSSKPS